jgi:ribosome-binding ATPase YchF (GTP1/OBG family)
MGFKCGIVGLPNVGKSTLFNALTQTAAAQAANYPFCTIEPNVGEVAVPEPRLQKLAEIGGSATVIPARMNFVDIAGLVKGASQGEGLGNQFLANIRETDAILYVLRCFEDGDITHVAGKRRSRLSRCRDNRDGADAGRSWSQPREAASEQSSEKKVQVGGDKEAVQQDHRPDAGWRCADAGRRQARRAMVEVAEDDGPEGLEDASASDRKARALCSSPTWPRTRPQGPATPFPERPRGRDERDGSGRCGPCVVISAKIEDPRSRSWTLTRREMFLDRARPRGGGARPDDPRGLRRCCSFETYFTAGPKEARAWTIPVGWTRAPQAAGVIHGDFERGFIRAETTAYDDYVSNGGESGAREAGKLRQEGKEYVVQDGDVMLFKFNV